MRQQHNAHNHAAVGLECRGIIYVCPRYCKLRYLERCGVAAAFSVLRTGLHFVRKNMRGRGVIGYRVMRAEDMGGQPPGALAHKGKISLKD